MKIEAGRGFPMPCEGNILSELPLQQDTRVIPLPTEVIIADALKRNHLNQQELAQKARVAQSLVSYMLSGEYRQYTIGTLSKISQALGLNLMQLINSVLSKEDRAQIKCLDEELEKIRTSLLQLPVGLWLEKTKRIQEIIKPTD